jgi:hydroxypyruvate reductase
VAAVAPGDLVRTRVGVERGTVLLRDDRGTTVARHRGPVYVTGAGKAALAMAAAAAALEPARGGDVIVPSAGGTAARSGALRLARSRRVHVHEGGHPLPTDASVVATRAVVEGIAGAGVDALVVVLLSGGASSLLCAPAPGVTLEDKRRVTEGLLACGAPIGEINVVRKHLSSVKGGELARLVAPRALWTLVLSDVVGDDLATIGSGPTVPDPSTFADALAIVARYGLEGRLPAAIDRRLRTGAAGRCPETPKHGDACFARTRHEIVGGNRDALQAAAARARALGYEPCVLDAPLVGDTTAAARGFGGELCARQRRIVRPACVIAGGETTVRVCGAGRGGRNQEFALAAALSLRGVSGITLLSAGTDGIDGPTDAAGAFAGGETIDAAERLGVDARASLAANDSYRFFDALGDLFRPGPTGTNVMDLKIALVEAPGA